MLTRHEISENRPAEEIRKELKKYELAFADLSSKHAELTMLIEDDNKFEHEEAWMEQCQDMYLKLLTDIENYLKERSVSSQNTHEIFCYWQPTCRKHENLCQSRWNVLSKCS